MPPKLWHIPDHRRKTSLLVWAVAIVCAILAIAAIITGIVVFAVYMIYQPKMPYIKVADAHLYQLLYGNSGSLEIEMALSLLAENDNNKALTSFSDLSFILQFHGIDVAELRAVALEVPKNSSTPLNYHFQSLPVPMDEEAMEAVSVAVQRGVVPFYLSGNARTRWKAGIFLSVRFWTRLSCELRFFWPNGSAVESGCVSRLH
ncbi:hypothetical protein Cni_G03688 [Canna indica]|uniref:Late embryogenesis abundant protein LEA-2 subgroup domain-containing protein n=1 Tax=Canna indica TaxID=4628 RepID=A0AAQ3JRK8_9LILI|nr:hypothetical protein Cni_G03688 [Canna indica]